jgi:methylmalonyl-CoA mutase N-terminal domain/subunit
MTIASETEKRRWERQTLEPSLAKTPERAASFTTLSGWPIERLYTSDDRDAVSGTAGRTRCVSLYARHSRLGLPRQAVDDAAVRGFGTPEDTNGRYKALLAAGGTG